MVDLQAALTALKAANIGCTGFSLLSETDSALWTFYGIAPANRPRAVAIVEALLAAPASSTFWPSSIDQLRADIALIKRELGIADA